MTKGSKLVGVVSLGCDKNRVDTERMLSRLVAGGYEITPQPQDAQVIIVNTCAFINAARKEAVDTVLEMASYKQTGKLERLIVTGCLPAGHKKELQKGIPEVDAFLGTEEYDGICEVVASLYPKEGGDGVSAEKAPAADGPAKSTRILTTPLHYAYLKIAEGCNNRCSFCTIPSIRGPYRSFSSYSLLTEAHELAAGGVRELILVAQDTARYGTEGGASPGLHRLLPLLADIPGIEWVRLLYCYPEAVTDGLLDVVANHPRVARYIDIPFQHADDGVLQRMNRQTTYADMVSLMERIRKASPEIAVRTTFIAGFPGESEDAFERLCRFVTDYRPEHAGFFPYSREQGTPAYSFPDQIPAAVKSRRVKTLARLQYENVLRKNTEMIGSTVRVLYEGVDYDRGLFYGRTQQNAPDIDGKVYFKGTFADVGQFYNVKVTGVAGGYDLKGKMV
ncbi:MAG: 30S ribosomal protein S12 methylthiotransferase RimO [Clostridiales bacterium]|jgi:ribosomal protein S12 methylthiotransferase|nr:30S ribosomal protein S12 methylthiotransferase RimO [Clostridiales bacterium]